jgi:hypothetical protein
MTIRLVRNVDQTTHTRSSSSFPHLLQRSL